MTYTTIKDLPEIQSSDLSGDEYIMVTDNTVDSVSSKFTVDSMVVYVGNHFDNTVDSKLDLKVDKITGKGLSTEDFSTLEKQKLQSLENYTHPESGVTPGSYTKVTINSLGHTTAGSNPNTLEGYSITDAYTKTEVQTILPKVGFDITNNVAPSAGQVAWNIDENTLDLGLNGATLQIGQEQLIRVRNNTVSSIPNGSAVMATGTLGNSGRITVAPANLTQATAKYILGIVTETIPAGADGFCTTFGKVRGIDTTGSTYGESWSDGDVLYVKDSGNGALTKVVPTDIEVKLPTAIVIHAHSSGTIFVRVNSIDENHAKADLALKANINSPALTGTPTAPTAVVGTNTTQIATTEYVVAEIDKIEEW